MLPENKNARDSLDHAAQILAEIPSHVTVVAVSKLHPSEAIRNLHSRYGVQNFGENYVQEATRKLDELRDLKLVWHFIGTLQKNKAKAVCGQFDLIHSVDSLTLAQAINRHAQDKKIVQKILLQVNVAKEESKGGVAVEEIDRTLVELKELRCISLAGLMTMPPLDQNNRNHFASLRQVRDRVQSEFPGCRFLSMGTSSDYKIAIEEGATHIRLGTVLFGQRPSKSIS